MTAILSWFNQEPGVSPHIMTIGDTKISSVNGGTLEGGKIFELPIKCKDLTTIKQEVYYTGTIGCAIAGSTLVAYNVYSFLQVAFANLGGRQEENTLPSYIHLCEKAEQALRLYVPCIKSPAEIMLFGFCPKDNIPFIGCIRTVQNKDGEAEFTTEINVDFKNEVTVFMLGDFKAEILDIVNERLKEGKHVDDIWYWRKPASILADIIRDSKFDTIGGNLQIGLCFNGRYDSYQALIVDEDKKATLKFRNIDFSEELMQHVGPCMIALGGYQFEEIG